MSEVKKSTSVCPGCQRLSLDGKVHERCKHPLGFDGLVSIWAYEGVVRRAILALKYKFAMDIAKELSEKITSEVKKDVF